MTEPSVQTIDSLVALERVMRRLGPALRAFAAALLVEAGEPADDALGLLVEAFTEVLDRQGFDAVLAERAAYDVVTTVLLSGNDPTPA